MSVPPYLLDLRVAAPAHRPFHLWLPLFLLWPLLLVIAVLTLVLTIIADIVLWTVGQRYHRYTFFLLGCFGLMAGLRGTAVRIHSADTLVDLTIM